MTISALLTVACAVAVALPGTARSESKPNVLFIAVDDMNDWIGCLEGHPQALTPNMDRLAARGVLFTNAHCAAPACNPSRAAVFSGLMPDKTGVWSNESGRIGKLQPDARLLPESFAKAGYRTLGTGKLLHSGGSAAFDDYFSVGQRWSPLTRDAVRYTDKELPSKGTDNPRQVVKDSRGMKIVLPLNRMPSDRRPDGKDGESFDWGPFDVPDSDFGDTQITDWAIGKLKAGSGKPLFLGVGYYRPHIPLWAPRRFFDRFKDDPGTLPSVREDDLDDLGEVAKKWAVEPVTAGSHATVVKHKQWQAAVEAYLACITYVDHEIGRLLAALDDSGAADNTVIVLWSDHGWHLGEKEHWGKWTGWERSTRVPLIIVPPKNAAGQFAAAGSRCGQPVGLIDLYPTLTELCGVTAPGALDGRSLVPLLRDPAKDTGRSVVTTFDPGNHSLRTDHWRFIRYADGSEELYDLRKDPHEWENLAAAGRHDGPRGTVRKRLDRHLAASTAPGPEAGAVPVKSGAPNPAGRPNILWICVDDMSDWVGCYGYTAVETPHIDRLAENGVRFAHAYMPSPVCSATRSALITGTMPTSHGLHQHRTMIKKPLPDGIRTVPELFREAGYLTFNEAKDDYNFSRDRGRMYSPEFKRPKLKGHLAGLDVSWLEQLQGKRFFGQIQLKGGKIGGESGSKFPAPSRIDGKEVTVPPYYPDDPVMRNAIARHYEQIAETDEQVGAIIAALKEYGLWENTAVFFFTDHGCPLPRSKQFLYEDGTKVPLIVHWPQGAKRIGSPGTVREDLVSGIDISTSSLALAGIPVPSFMEAVDVFADGYQERSHVISARDRCGIAVDRIRAVRTPGFRYIRNYQTDRPLFQANYRDGFATFTALRKLHADGKLTPLQASYFDAARRPAEELYDLRKDPHQVDNLAADPACAAVLDDHRRLLEEWEKESDDQGKDPESRASLRLVYEVAKGICPAPEFDFLRQEAKP